VAARGAIGVYAVSTGEDAFLMSGGIGVFGTSEGSGWAARFDGEVTVNGVRREHQIGGRAEVLLATDFAAIVDTTSYHVFVTPHDANCPGPFSYRIVARRKDMTPPRRAPISPEAAAAVTPPERPPAPTPPEPPPSTLLNPLRT
jgi:hypothetical protein